MNNIPILLSILFYNDINKNLFLIVLYSIESRVQIEQSMCNRHINHRVIIQISM